MKRKILLLSLVLSILMVVQSFATVGHINGCTNTDFTENCCTKTFNIVPKAGYRIVDVKVNGISKGAITSYTFTNLTQAQTMKVITEPLPTITVMQGSNGTITPGTTIVNYGDSQVFTITPNEGYVIASLVVNGINQTVSNEEGMTYTFNNVTSNQTITATFEEYWPGWNEPALIDGLTPVNWDGEDWATVDDVADWDYNYNSVATETQSTVAGNGNGKWANAMTADGSMYVWIPRYTYKIETGYHSSGNSWNSLDNPGGNKILIKFSNGTEDDTSDIYIEHPAFTFGSDELTGIWVAKYEASQGTTTDEVSVPTDSTNVAKFVPGVSGWRSISVSKMYDYAYNTFRNADSHLMKNVEWGAVAYLTNAIGRIPYKNYNSDYITGIAGDSQNASQSSDTTNAWNTTAGVKASTTHNVYGIYDMSGGASEYVSAFIYAYDSLHPELLSRDVSDKKYAGSLYTAANNSSTAKYVDIYSTAYTSSKIGDAVYGTSGSVDHFNSWDEDDSVDLNAVIPVFCRGGCFNDYGSGIFSFDGAGGSGFVNISFRAVLAIP